MHDYGLITPENLQTWASEQQLSGTFMIEPNTTKGVPYIGYWLGIVTIINKEPNNGYGLYIFNHNDTYCCMTDAGKWTVPWLKLTSNKYLSNPSLLDNWYFGRPVNQRDGYIVPKGTQYYKVDGFIPQGAIPETIKVDYIDYAGSARFNYNNVACYVPVNGGYVSGYCAVGYTVDRWKLDIGEAVTLEDGCICLKKSGTFWGQYFDDFDQFIGMTLTGSVLLSDGTLRTGSFVYNGLLNQGQTFFSSELGFYIQKLSSSLTQCEINSLVDSVKIKAVKLELGDAQTLAHKENDKWVLNEIPDFGEQLRKCIYYTEKVEDRDTPAITNSTFIPSGATSAVFILPYARKRTVPAINFNDVSNYRVIARTISGGTTAFSVTAISLLDIARTKAAILVSFNATDQGYYCFLQRSDNAPAGYAFISADL